ncbi:MAG: hypothetical protein GX049_00745, partial [Alcaligenaceae bacterium]|nr:hypothetical protein [Alcaligenaceae bacterium]
MNGTIPTSFKFTSANEVVEALNGTWDAPGGLDVLRDVSTADNDTLNALVATAGNLGIAPTLQNIENINITLQNAGNAGTLSLLNVTGAKQVTLSGTATTAGVSNFGASGVTVVNASGVTSGAVTITPTSNTTADLTITGGAGGDNYADTGGVLRIGQTKLALCAASIPIAQVPCALAGYPRLQHEALAALVMK